MQVTVSRRMDWTQMVSSLLLCLQIVQHTNYRHQLCIQ